MVQQTLIISGSHRVGSHSVALATAVADVLTARGQAVEVVEIARLDLPLHDPVDHRDPEGSADPRVREFAARVRAATSMIWITPIYHGSYTAGLKNALDNINMALVAGKPIALMAHGGGRFGGSVIEHLRTIALNLHGRISNVAVLTNRDDFVVDDSGPQLRNEQIEARLARLVDDLLAAESHLAAVG